MSRPWLRLALFCVASVALLACQAGGPATSSSPSSDAAVSPDAPSATLSSPTTAVPSQEFSGWTLVALGDSEATGSGDASGGGWVEYYADLVRDRGGQEVRVVNLAQDGTLSGDLLESVRTDGRVREQIAAADIVVLGIGGADLNRSDARMDSGECEGTACYDPEIAAYRENIDAIAGEIMAIRDGEPTLLGAITMPNALTGAEDIIPPFLAPIATEIGVHQARGFNAATCDAMEAHGGACIDVLTAINGPYGDRDGYAAGLLNLEQCCYPDEAGHGLIAQLLMDTGLAPLVDS
jgi:hypothetical protein